MTKFNPFAQEIKFLNAVNKAIVQISDLGNSATSPFTIYRTVDGKVQSFPLTHMGINLYTGELQVTFDTDGHYNMTCEKATKQDLILISQKAQQLSREYASKK